MAGAPKAGAFSSQAAPLGSPENATKHQATDASPLANAAKRSVASGLHTEERRMAQAQSKQENTEVGGIASERLRSIVERIERLEEEKKALSSDIKDIFAEAKSAGFDVKVLRAVIRLRKQEPAEVEEQETLLDLYRRALGM
jgi:uncharacterized protein (UPF0335 family)